MTVSAVTARFADRYRVVRRLGTGGMATVFLAEDERLGRQVAIKRLHADSPEDVARRFEREARLGASLNHPNLVAVYDTVADLEGVLIVMEHVDGPSLEDVLNDRGLLPDRVLEVLDDVAAALDHAHAHGIVHRDLKPANVLLREDGDAKLADLGIAVAVEEAAHLTHTGTVLGTAAYMAPEQLDGGSVGPAADVYALGALAFEMLAGRPARGGDTPMEVAYRVVTEPLPDLRDAWPQAPPEVAEALRAAMAPDPADRPATAGELVEWVGAGLAGEHGTPAPRRVLPGLVAAGAGFRPGGPGTSGSGSDATRGGGARGTDGQPARSQGTRERTRPAWSARLIPPIALGVLVLLAAAALILSLTWQDRAESDARSVAEQRAANAARLDPGETVTAFYRRAAAGDYRGAWRLAAPGFRRELGGFGVFRDRMASLESIEFSRSVVAAQRDGSARMRFQAVADYTDGVDRCEGTLTLVRGGPSGWLIEAASISCPQSSRPGGTNALGTEEPTPPPSPAGATDTTGAGGGAGATGASESPEGSAGTVMPSNPAPPEPSEGTTQEDAPPQDTTPAPVEPSPQSPSEQEPDTGSEEPPSEEPPSEEAPSESAPSGEVSSEGDGRGARTPRSEAPEG